MTALEWVSAILLVFGCGFFLAGTIGLLRFRDVHSRLHALSKADNLGLGFVSVSLILHATNFSTGAKVFLIWLMALFASAVTCYVIAEWEINHGRED